MTTEAPCNAEYGVHTIRQLALHTGQKTDA